MQEMLRWGRTLASLLIVVGVLTSAWATCVEGARSTLPQQMACCKAGHDRCPMRASAADCCKKSGPQGESQATIVKATSITAPVSVPLSWEIVPALSLAAAAQPHVSYHAPPPDLLYTPPAYIAFSSLLI
jgi:hypothetical protein